jgi:4-diphosphocytidyl-2-C-methyl-D-erythritol kinase
VAETRYVRVPCYAKINRLLTVLNRGADGFHELRTVFETISLADSLELYFTPGQLVEPTLEAEVDIPDNLVLRAARQVLAATGAKGHLHLKLVKRIPMGGGLGGGSTDAAAVLLALPVLTGKPLLPAQAQQIAAALGSDVPFFLYGGRALGLGRGTELYPLAESDPEHLLLVAPPIHVSTPDAYRAFDRAGNGKLTEEDVARYIGSFQTRVWDDGKSLSPKAAGSNSSENDFERVVFQKHPQLKSTLNQLKKLGAAPARMTGSGAALYGIFRNAEQVQAAMSQFGSARVYAATTLSRRKYQASWWRSLQQHIDAKQWPPRSRYAR